MPTYEYVCSSCRRHTEAQQRFSDPPLTECPHCGGALKRVFHPVGIVLKGSGFYSTDNRSGKSKVASSTGPGGETSSTETASESKGESAPATKSGSGSKDGSKAESKPGSKPGQKPETKSSDKPKKAPS